MNVPPLITYPARPIQGGRLELAPPKRGLWYAEPKLNGWRTLIHTPTGTMWNRQGSLLTIADCFRPALAALAKLATRGLVWADCEALERRHNLGRGTLVVLDVVPESGTPCYEQRRAMLETIIPTDAVFTGDTARPVRAQRSGSENPEIACFNCKCPKPTSENKKENHGRVTNVGELCAALCMGRAGGLHGGSRPQKG